MASRFWAGSSSEDEGNSDENLSNSDDENNDGFGGGAAGAGATPAASRWAIDSESDSEEEVRVVRSAKDKAFITLEKSVGLIKNHMKINDWTKLMAEFDVMTKNLEKAKGIIATQGHPKYYIRCIASLEDYINAMIKDKDGQKKMGKENNKSFSRMKTKIKRHVEELESPLKAFREKPDSSESESEEDSSSDESEDDDSEEDSDEDSDSDESEKASQEDDDNQEDVKPKVKATGDDSEDEWPSGSESSSSSEDEIDDGHLKGRSKWLKTAVVQTKSKKERGPKVQKIAKVRKLSIDLQQKKETENELEVNLLTPAQFDTKLKEIVSSRGKRGTEFSDQLVQLRRLVYFSKKLGAARQIMATMNMVSAQLFDSSRIDRVLNPMIWRSILKDIDSIVALLETNPDFSLVPLSSEDHAEIGRVGRGDLKEEELEEEMVLPADGTEGPIKASGDLASFVIRLSEEYIKSLQQLDPHTSDYISRLYDEGGLVDTAVSVQTYCFRKHEIENASSMALLQIEFHYYKHVTIAEGIHIAQTKRKMLGDFDDFHPSCLNADPVTTYDASLVHPGSWSGKPVCDITDIDVEVTMRDLCLFVYQHGDDRSKTRAMLCDIYHHALHDRYEKARDLLLMSHLQDTILLTDIPTQILFNRMMAQLGLCAFRAGLILQAHGCLTEICNGNRTKELLAQGVQNARFSDQNAEQEKLERRRQTPYHMHINLELLEYCHLTAAMLLEVPNMAATAKANVLINVQDRGNRKQRNIISKNFRRYLDIYNRQVFSGPPENTRDHIIAASKYLAQGECQKARELLLKLKVWNLFPGENVASSVKEMVENQIQIQGLRTYLLTYGSEYDSLSLIELCTMFELPQKEVHSVVSKMIINDEIMAAWDQESQSILMHPIEQTKLQQLSLAYADKVALLVENNERMLEFHNVSSKEKSEWGNNNNGGNTNNRRNNSDRDGGGYNRGGGGGNRNNYRKTGGTGGNYHQKKKTNGGGGGGNRWSN